MLLVAAYRRTNLTMRQLAPLFGVSKSAADNRDDCKAWAESGAKAAIGKTMTIADGGHPGTGLLMPQPVRPADRPSPLARWGPTGGSRTRRPTQCGAPWRFVPWRPSWRAGARPGWR
ncbi:hypothetical protein GCM10010349_43830 [Streptomyces flavofungini]|nr:hypothetical protein GCM10010349_43830 [Streptomyces flavofungini]